MTSTALHSPAAVQSVDFPASLDLQEKHDWRGLMVGIELVTDRKEKTPAKAKTAVLFEKLRAGGSGWKRYKFPIITVGHGLIRGENMEHGRGENMEHGRDSDTVGHVRYVVELARALASMPGMRPGGGPMANFLMPMVQQGQQGQRPGGRRVHGPDDATWADVPVPPGQNVVDASVGGITGGGMVSVSYDIGGMPLRETRISQPIPISALASALANALPTEQRTIHMRDDDMPLAQFAVAFNGASWTDPDSIALMVIQAMLDHGTKVQELGNIWGLYSFL
ncbi:hypothetical protein L2E82_09020 [Cichorium intybus]|uniref:Uncharacterized protein n=1 Tax=Cichorium intybus TaxID=13427 RepID=A0ACB9G7C7_CICIN|nr:hypothetical protein L2E82_09020 [Cichorium intybus]